MDQKFSTRARQFSRCAVLLLLVAATACGPRIPRSAAGPGAPAASAAVERFLHLVQQKEYLEMGWVFGTEKGPIIRRDPLPDVEKRMYAIADILDHEAFTVRSERPVPGRVGAATRVEVRMTTGGREVVVPFTAVRDSKQRWYVEQVDLVAVTRASTR